jgi:hypothetical protein
MKKRQQHNQIASYYIKTVLLFMVEQRNDAFWKQSLSTVFLDTLETYTKYIRNKKIPYYWNEEYNLIGHIDPPALWPILPTDWSISSIISKEIQTNLTRWSNICVK